MTDKKLNEMDVEELEDFVSRAMDDVLDYDTMEES